MVGECFPGGENVNLLFNSDIVNLLLKFNEGRSKRVFFSVWNAFIVGGWVGGGVEQIILFRVR